MQLRLADNVAWREIDGETFVIDLKRKRMYGLNDAGGQVWRTLERGADLPWGHAVQGFVDEMLELGLLCGEASRVEADPAASETTPVLPRVVWREELRSFAFSCGRISGETPACEQVPTT